MEQRLFPGGMVPHVVPLGDHDVPSDRPTPEDEVAARETKALLETALQTLSPREEKVVRMRFGVSVVDDDAASLQEQGKGFPLVQERLRLIEAKTLRKVRGPRRK